MFEAVGSFLVTALFVVCSYNGDYVGFASGVFVATCMGVQLTGAHYNPAITLCFMLKSHQRASSRWLGVGYIVF